MAIETYNHDEDELVKIDPAGASAMQAIVTAEVDIQVSTAKRFPRSIDGALKRAMSMATLDEETAASCMYALPRGRGEDGRAKIIEGPSVRLAEIFATAWGNMRIEARVVGQDDRWVTARGVCWDLETNNAVALTVQRRITGKDGRKFNEDMINVTSNAANSIARRNAIFATVPRAYVMKIYEQCKRVAVGTVETLDAKRKKALDYFVKAGIPKERIFESLGIKGEDDIDLERMGTLVGIASAIRAGEVRPEEAFPIPDKEAADTKMAAVKETAESAKEKMRNKTKGDGTPALSDEAWAIETFEGFEPRDFNSYCESKEKDPAAVLKVARSKGITTPTALYALIDGQEGLGV